MKPRKFRNSDGSTSWKVTVAVRPFKRVTRSFETAKAAREWAVEHARELRQHRSASRNVDITQLTIAGLVELFLADPETQALKYLSELERNLAWWVNWTGSTRILRAGAMLWREGRDKLRPGKSAATVNRYLSSMRSAWNWGRAAEIVPTNLVWPSRLMLTEPKGRTRHLSDPELAALLKAASDHSPVMHAAILVSIACGVRQSELLRLKWSDVDFEKQRLRVLLSKNDEARAVYLPGSAVAVLRELWKAAVIGQTVITDEAGQPVTRDWIEYRWRPIREAAGLKDFHWHDLRHSCASFLAQQGANLLEIGSVLGHKSPAVTKRYAHLVEGAPVTGHTKLDEKLRGS